MSGFASSKSKMHTLEIYRSRPPGVVDRYIYKKKGNAEIFSTTSNYFNKNKNEAGIYTRNHQNNYDAKIKEILSEQPKKRTFKSPSNFHGWNVKIDKKEITQDNPHFLQAIELVKNISNESGWKEKDIISIELKPDFKIVHSRNGLKKEIKSKFILEVCNKMTNSNLTCEFDNKFIYFN